MKDSYEQRIQNQFGAFCVKVLKNEARHIQRDYASLLDQEKPLDELTASELEQTAVWDDYFMDEHVFEVLGLPVVVTGNVLADALAQLPEGKRMRSPFSSKSYTFRLLGSHFPVSSIARMVSIIWQ